MSEDRRKHRVPQVGPRDVAGEANAEIESHLAMRVADLVADGWEPGAARAEALRRFGDPARVKSEMVTIDRSREISMRRSRYFADLGQDVRVAARQLRKRPFFATVVVTVIALGIGATAAVFAVVDGALLRPLPFAAGDRLVYLWDGQRTDDRINASFPEFRDWQREADFLKSIMGVFGNAVTLQTRAGSELLIAAWVAGDPSGTVGMRPLLGRWFTPDEMRTTARVAMLDETLWRERFAASHAIIGQPLRLDQGVYTVIGVLPRAAQLLRAGGKAQLWLPGTEQPPFDRGFHFMRVLGRLRDDVTPAQAAARAQLMSKRIQGAGLTDHSVRLESARDVLVGDSRRILLVLLAAVGFVLLIVCANLANLFLTKSVERGREFAVRIALGAGRIRVLRQLLTESVLIAVLGGVAGLALAHVLIGVTRAVADKAGGLAPASSADPRVALFTLLVSATVGALFGLWPALRAARFDLAGILRESDGRSVGGRSAWRRRRVLVGFEIALSVVLLTGAGLLVRSLLSTLSESPGFDEHDVVAFGVSARGKRYEDDAGQAGYAQDLLSRVVQIRGVTAVGAVSHLPLDGGDTSGPLDIVGRDFPEGTAPEIKKRIATPGYFAALGIPLLRGRDFSAADRMGSRDVVIITESLARRFWPGRDPIGQRVRFGWGPGAEEQEIVGVVGDILHDGLDQPSQGMLYRPFAQFPQSGFTLVVKAPGDPAALVRAVRAAVHALDASVPLYQVRTMSSVIRESVAPRRSLMQMLVGFAALALVLAAVGVYAVTAQSVSQRTREIGVRLAIGATRNEILRMVLTAEAKVIAVSVVIGLTVAGAATGMLSSVLYGVSATDVTTFGAAAVLLSVVALAASCIPAIRAARLDPSSALRAD